MIDYALVAIVSVASGWGFAWGYWELFMRGERI
jgi:hypothetical protein